MNSIGGTPQHRNQSASVLNSIQEEDGEDGPCYVRRRMINNASFEGGSKNATMTSKNATIYSNATSKSK